MITVKNENGRTDRVTVGKAFKIDTTGALLVFDSTGAYANLVRAYAPGKWYDAVVEVKQQEKPAIDLNKLSSLLQPEEELVLTYNTYARIDPKAIDSITSAGVTKEFWNKHPISLATKGNSEFIEEMIVAVSRAYLASKEDF